MSKTITLNIRVPKDIKKKLDDKASEDKRSTNNLISKILQDFIEKPTE
ncbi:MAG: Arc family DNA-binding protein [Gammaproteobacteria bacterium]|nr:Arc family DNA-binding protein [Gammaproteobacteria bacterium]